MSLATDRSVRRRLGKRPDVDVIDGETRPLTTVISVCVPVIKSVMRVTEKASVAGHRICLADAIDKDFRRNHCPAHRSQYYRAAGKR